MEPELKKYYINRAFKYLFRNLANWLLTNSGLESMKCMMSRSIHLNVDKREKKNWPVAVARGFLYVLLLVIQGLDGAGQDVAEEKQYTIIHQIQDRYLFCSSYSESWMWASSSFELVRLSPRAPWGIKDEYRACYNIVTCHEHFQESWPALWQSRHNHDQSCSEPQPPGISCQHLAYWK